MSKAALKKRVTIRLSGPLLRRLEAAAEADSRPVASIIRKVLGKHVPSIGPARSNIENEPQTGREMTP
jgi:predicted DNA-binding protein